MSIRLIFQVIAPSGHLNMSTVCPLHSQQSDLGPTAAPISPIQLHHLDLSIIHSPPHNHNRSPLWHCPLCSHHLVLISLSFSNSNKDQQHHPPHGPPLVGQLFASPIIPVHDYHICPFTNNCVTIHLLSLSSMTWYDWGNQLWSVTQPFLLTMNSKLPLIPPLNNNPIYLQTC